MAKGDYPGEFELVVLLTVLRLGDDAYGMQIRREIEERTGRDVSIGAVYATLDRLRRKGLIEAEMGEPTAERGGRAKRFFELSRAGEVALARSREMFASLLEGIEELP